MEFMGAVSIIHNPTGKVKLFEHPREAQKFLEEYTSKKLPLDLLTINNTSGVSLSAYQNRIPTKFQDFIAKVELGEGGNLVPKWHWIPKNRSISTGTTYYTKGQHAVSHIAISAGTDEIDLFGVILHEMSHALTKHSDGHNRTFYRMLFRLLGTYLSGHVSTICAREFKYKKSSRYWYAEYFNITSILEEYRRPERVAAIRLTPEERTRLLTEKMFSQEF